MNIAGLNYYLGRRCLEIYISGCSVPHCVGCHNPELQAFNPEDNLQEYLNKIKIRIQTGMVNEVWILGGEPLDQNLVKLEKLVRFIKDFDVDVWLWTKYENYYDRINFMHLIDYVKYGKYKKELPAYIDKETGIELASINQKIVKI